MKILLAQHYGVCFGVRDAVTQAHRMAEAGDLTILGELAHNPVIRQRLQTAGVTEGNLTAVGSATTPRVMITAHGASDKAKAAWSAAGYEVSDASCPLVKYAHKQLAQLVRQGYFPVVFGLKGHVEVNGLTEDFPDAIVILDEAAVAQLPVQARYGVISQTTQPLAKVQAFIKAMQAQFPQSEVRFVDTVCRPTKDRQRALNQLLEEADRVVVVGGFNSNNTKQLALTCQQAGLPAYHVSSASEIDPSWFVFGETVGLTAGTSTLKETVELVRLRLEEIAQTLQPAFSKSQRREELVLA